MISFELVIDIVVITLLLLTIIYIWRLNHNLSVLRKNQDSMFNLAQSLNEASDKAKNAVAGLKSAAADTAEDLQNVVEDAKSIKESLLSISDNAQKTVARLDMAVKDAQTKKYSFADSSFSNQPASNEKSETELELLKALRSIR